MLMDLAMKVNFSKTSPGVKASKYSKTEQFTKDNSKMDFSMERAITSKLMALNIKAIGTKMKLEEKASKNLNKMELSSEVISLEDKLMARATKNGEE